MTDSERMRVAVAVSMCGMAGWTVGGPTGSGIGLLTGVALGVMPWRGQPLWVWARLCFKGAQPLTLADPVTLSTDQSSGGVRYQDGVAVSAIRVLGKAHQPTVGPTVTVNVLDVSELLSGMHQSIGLTVDSLSVVCVGARRRSTGDYPRIYDAMLGPGPFAGQRETWLIVRVRSTENAEALRCRGSVGAAALAASHRIAAGLRYRGVRAHVATAEQILSLDGKLGCKALKRGKHRWHSVRDEDGWLTTYAYSVGDVKSDVLEQVWALRADGVIQNVTIFPDGTAIATATLRHAQPPRSSPSLRFRTLPGQQGPGLAANLCGPRPNLRGVGRAELVPALAMPIGPSGVLLGRLPDGNRLLLPLSDPGRATQVHIAATDAVAKRVVMRVLAAGDRVTVHTRDFHRWMSLRSLGLTVTDQQQPDDGTTVSVVDGTAVEGTGLDGTAMDGAVLDGAVLDGAVLNGAAFDGSLAAAAPVPRPATVIFVGSPNAPDLAGADVVIRQIGPAVVQVSTAGQVHLLDVEFFEAEDRYVTRMAG